MILPCRSASSFASVTVPRPTLQDCHARPVLECVVNVSEGRRPQVLGALVAAAGPDLLDLHVDPDHHRSVLTLVGEEAPRAVAAAAVELIDLRRHTGAHPRLGAVDVVPFVALAPTPAAEAEAARDRFARWARAELRLPALRYGPSLPSLPERATLGPAAQAGRPSHRRGRGRRGPSRAGGVEPLAGRARPRPGPAAGRRAAGTRGPGPRAGGGRPRAGLVQPGRPAGRRPGPGVGPGRGRGSRRAGRTGRPGPGRRAGRHPRVPLGPARPVPRPHHRSPPRPACLAGS